MRRLIAMGAGAVLALLLFFGLALLVAPPEALQQPERPLTVTMTEAPTSSETAPATQPTQTPLPSPPAAPPHPAAAPPPAPEAQSSVALPQSDAPPPERPEVELDATLPDLDVERPEPAPKPEPRPQPRTTPDPEPAPSPAPTPASQPSPAQRQQNSAASSSTQAAQDLLSARQKGLIKPVKLEKPEYPRRARMRGTEGFVEVQFMIQTNGRVDRSSIKIVESRPGSTFDDAARDAVSGWVFQRLDSPVRIIQRLEFKLRG